MNRYLSLPAVMLMCTLTPANAGSLRVDGQLISDAPQGTAPLQVGSTTSVPNLNADLLDGMTAADFAGVSELATAGSGVGVHWKNLINLPVVEIDQDCAVNTGCSTGSDTAGFPVTITQPGSYRLAGNLTTADENTTLISIQASNVSLDLNGFALTGPVTCTGTPVTDCSPSGGTGDGIEVTTPPPTPTGVTIRNGTVEGMDVGISCVGFCKIVTVHVAQNARSGISAAGSGRGGIVENVAAFRNGNLGISVHGVLRNSIALGNGDNGIQATGSVYGSRAVLNALNGFNVTGSVINSASENNDLRGFVLQAGSTAIGNSAVSNGSDGFFAATDATFKDNASYNNEGNGFAGGGVFVGNLASGNTVDGFSCTDCLLTDNVSKDNTDQGVAFSGPDSAWEGNMLSGNTNAVSGSRVDLGNNACDGSLTC